MSVDKTLIYDTVRIFPIGDTHLCTKEIDVSRKLVEKIISVAERSEANLIVHLGDVFDTFGNIQTDVHTLGMNFIISLSKIAPVLLLIGNHDRKKGSKEFLSTNHFFNGLCGLSNIYIADISPISIYFDNDGKVTKDHTSRRVIGIPYIPPGQLDSTLAMLKPSIDTHRPMCVFAHQELQGFVYGGKPSVHGDVWDKTRPFIVCGHIHERQFIKPNRFCAGSSRQVATDEEPNKGITILDFEEGEYTLEHGATNTVIPVLHKCIPLRIGLKLKNEIDIADIHTYTPPIGYKVTLHVYGTASQFRTSSYLDDMMRLYNSGIIIKAHHIVNNKNEIQNNTNGSDEGVSENSSHGILQYKDLTDGAASLTPYKMLLSRIQDNDEAVAALNKIATDLGIHMT